MKLQHLLISLLVTILIVIVAGLFSGIYIQSYIKELFRMNKELQEENYYMAEFEFKMLGLSYLLDKGHYYSALQKLHELHSQMESREGLFKIPEFKNKNEELEFYLNLQNPKTGAFMDDSYPLNTYHEPTINVLLHLDALAEEIQKPLKLKYPLYYLDNFNTSEKINTILEDWSTVGWLALRFPQNSFHNVRDLLILARDAKHHDVEEFDLVIQKHNFYNFTPEWKHNMLQWFYDHQDPTTGIWGPKLKNGELAKIDLGNTASILKTFVDNGGNNIYHEFPLRYDNELFKTILSELVSEPPENEDDLDRWHEWGLKTPKGLRTLTRYLWKNASQANKQNAKKLIERYIKVKFEKFYIPREGAFSYYPYGEIATLDGTAGGFSSLNEFGALSSEKQTKLWGKPAINIKDLGYISVPELQAENFNWINNPNINSVRIYIKNPNYDDLTSNVYRLFYPKKTKVIDIVELMPKIKKWVDKTDQTIGNWVSKEQLKKQLKQIEIEEIPIHNNIPFNYLNQDFKEHRKLIIIGFDILQIPRFQITINLAK